VSKSDLELHFQPLPQAPSKKTLQAFQKDAGWSVSRREVEKMLTPNSRMQWVSVELNKIVIGIARLELAPPEFCHISDLTIKSKYRGQGVGRWFIKNIELFCAGLGIRRMLLLPESEALPFYEALSFTPDPYVPRFLKKEISPFQRKAFFPRQ
jgi:GNAT superfamily N-acetyltransferase